MEIPSHIGPNGISPIRSDSMNSDRSSPDSDHIELRTPPKVIKLDDSNIWGLNSTQIQPSAAVAPQMRSYNSINEDYFDGDLDSTEEVDKLRRQMYKVTRRLTKLEKMDEIKSRQIAALKAASTCSILIAAAAVTFQFMKR